MRPRTIFAALSAAAALTIVAGAAGIAGAQDHPGMGPPDMHQMQTMHARMLEDLRTVLRIRPDQEAAFKTFQDALSAPPPAPPPPPSADLTTPQMLAMAAQHEAEMKARLDRHTAAVLALYGVLSPDQQKALDALVRMHHMAGGMHGGPMGPGHMAMHMEMHGPMGGPPPH